MYSELNQELLKDAVDVVGGGGDNDASSRNLDQFIKGGDLHGGSKESEAKMDTDDATEVKLLICEVKCLNISQIPVLRQVKTCKSAFVGFTCFLINLLSLNLD